MGFQRGRAPLAGQGQRPCGVAFFRLKSEKNRGRAHRCNALRCMTSPGARIGRPVSIRPTPIYDRTRFARSASPHSWGFAPLPTGGAAPRPLPGNQSPGPALASSLNWRCALSFFLTPLNFRLLFYRLHTDHFRKYRCFQRIST